MTAREHAETLWLNLLDLGPRRLAALAMVAVTMMALIAGSAYYLSRPQYTVLYTGLENGDASRIGSALTDAGISFAEELVGWEQTEKQAAAMWRIAARIDAGDYGYCDETGEPIGVGRLLARPTATLSLEAQQRRELKQKMFGD